MKEDLVFHLSNDPMIQVSKPQNQHWLTGFAFPQLTAYTNNRYENAKTKVLHIFTDQLCEYITSVPSCIWIICNTFFNLQGARMVDTDFIDIVTALPSHWPFSTPNSIWLLKLDNFWGIATFRFSINKCMHFLFISHHNQNTQLILNESPKVNIVSRKK